MSPDTILERVLAAVPIPQLDLAETKRGVSVSARSSGGTDARRGPARGRSRTGCCARSTSRSGAAWKACSRATTARRCSATGRELALIRPYVPGDDVRKIDWNVTARTGEPHVRVHLAERVLVTWLVLDTSPSMQLRHGRPAQGRRRGGRRDRRRPPRDAPGQPARRAHLRRRGAALAAGPPGPRRPGRAARRAARGARADARPDRRDLARRRASARTDALARQRSLVVVVSDFRGPRDWRKPLLQLAGRHEVVAVEIRDPREQELPNAGELWLVDPETGRAAPGRHAQREAPRRFAAAAEAERRDVATRARLGRRPPRRARHVRRLAPRRSSRSCGGRDELLVALVAALAARGPVAGRRSTSAPAPARAQYAERWASPGLLPNLVDRFPGRRRYVPVAILLAALAALIVGVARPHATVSVPREEATVMLAIDTSRSMGATDVSPTRLAAAAERGEPARRHRAEEVPDRRRLVLDARTARPRADDRPRARPRGARGARARPRARRSATPSCSRRGSGSSSGRATGSTPPTTRAADLRRRARRRPDRAARRRPARAGDARSRLHRAGRHAERRGSAPAARAGTARRSASRPAHRPSS